MSKGKYHISEDGVARPCEARKVPCKLEHHDTKNEAQAAYEKTNSDRGLSFSSSKKSCNKSLRKANDYLTIGKFSRMKASVSEVKDSIRQSFRTFAKGGMIPSSIELKDLRKDGDTVVADLDGMKDKDIREFANEKYKENVSDKKFSAVKKGVIIATSLALVTGMTACGSKGEFEPSPNFDDSASVVQTLNDADEIQLKKKMISFGDSWQVMADGEKVAEIKGQAFPVLGDTYAMYSNSGNVVGVETETFMIGDRSAKTYGYDTEKRGHIDQNVISVGYSFDIYGDEEEKTGNLRQKIALNLQANVNDNDGNTEYEVSKSVFTFGSKIKIDVIKDGSDRDVDAMDAIWSSVMMSEIDDAKGSSKSSSKN